MAQTEKQDNRYFLHASKDLMRLGPDLVYGPNPFVSSRNTKNPGSSARNKKRGDSTLINAFQDLLQIEPDLFEDLVVDDPVSYKPAQNKGKGVIVPHTRSRWYLEGKIPLSQYRLG